MVRRRTLRPASPDATIVILRVVGDSEAATFAEKYYAESATLDPIDSQANVQKALAKSGALSVTAWSSFAVWGAAGCAVGGR